MSELGYVWLVGMAWIVGFYAQLITEIRRGERKLGKPVWFAFMVVVDWLIWPLNFLFWFLDLQSPHPQQRSLFEEVVEPIPPPVELELWDKPEHLQDDLRLMLSHASEMGMDAHFRVHGSNIHVPLNDVITFHLAKR